MVVDDMPRSYQTSKGEYAITETRAEGGTTFSVFVASDTAGIIDVAAREDSPSRKTPRFRIAEVPGKSEFLAKASTASGHYPIASEGKELRFIEGIKGIWNPQNMVVVELNNAGEVVGGRACSLKPTVGAVQLLVAHETGIKVGEKVESVSSETMTYHIARNRLAELLYN